MTEDQIKVMLCLRYGTLRDAAYKWLAAYAKEEDHEFTKEEIAILDPIVRKDLSIEPDGFPC